MADVLVEDVCTFDNSLPWMQAIMRAVETNHVKVRVIVENANANGLENRVGIRVFQDELAKQGDVRILLEPGHSRTGCRLGFCEVRIHGT